MQANQTHPKHQTCQRVAGKSGLQAFQTHPKHETCQRVAGNSGLQANQAHTKHPTWQAVAGVQNAAVKIQEEVNGHASRLCRPGPAPTIGQPQLQHRCFVPGDTPHPRKKPQQTKHRGAGACKGACKILDPRAAGLRSRGSGHSPTGCAARSALARGPSLEF